MSERERRQVQRLKVASGFGPDTDADVAPHNWYEPEPGDDTPDPEGPLLVGLSFCPRDAHRREAMQARWGR